MEKLKSLGELKNKLFNKAFILYHTMDLTELINNEIKPDNKFYWTMTESILNAKGRTGQTLIILSFKFTLNEMQTFTEQGGGIDTAYINSIDISCRAAEPDNIFTARFRKKGCENMIEIRRGSARLINALICNANDTNIARLARILNYEPEQLQEDIQAINLFYDKTKDSDF